LPNAKVAAFICVTVAIVVAAQVNAPNAAKFILSNQYKRFNNFLNLNMIMSLFKNTLLLLPTLRILLERSFDDILQNKSHLHDETINIIHFYN